jgi:alpha-glucoside transport system permease protein
MPMAISMFAAGVIWHLMDERDPQRGTVNAAIALVRDTVSNSGVLESADPSTPAVAGSVNAGFQHVAPVEPGDAVAIGLTAIPPDALPAEAEAAVIPQLSPGAITGVVWRDFKPGGGRPGAVETGELGIPRATLALRGGDGSTVAETISGDDGRFQFRDVEPGRYRVLVSAKTFAPRFEGIAWLGPKLITPAIMIAYIWVWAGFAMVVIAAGLAALPRDVLEAARTDGASEWQVFRRVTVPLLAPVLGVVFVTMMIYVLKVFDIVLAVAPGSSQDDASVIALAMWRTSFGGVNDFGLGSAIAVFLLLLVLPVLALNVRRLRKESSQ